MEATDSPGGGNHTRPVTLTTDAHNVPTVEAKGMFAGHAIRPERRQLYDDTF